MRLKECSSLVEHLEVLIGTSVYTVLFSWGEGVEFPLVIGLD